MLNERDLIRFEKMESRIEDLERAVAALNERSAELALTVDALRRQVRESSTACAS